MAKTISVKGISCGYFVSSVEGALKGVTDVQVNLKNGTVTLNFDENLVDEDQIRVAIGDPNRVSSFNT